MTHEHADNLELELASLTRAVGAEPVLWKRALNATTAPASDTPRSGHRMFVRPSILTAAAAVLLCVLVVGAMLPSLGKARASRRVAPSAAVEQSMQAELSKAKGTLRDNELNMGYMPASPTVAGSPPSTPIVSERFVIRKAQIELKARDVRAAFGKAAMLLSEAQGEYLEESSLTGQEPYLGATLKLRVAATRLGSVLAGLRDLGTVTSETAGGEDVTEQMVDLEARIRNEQRVEAELLALLDSRKGEPLEGILRLRDSIGQVRQSIETMTARRERLGRLVSLATVLVIIRTDAAVEPEPAKSGLDEYFLNGVHDSWERGVRTLADTAAWLVRVLVGGAVWWILLIVGGIAIRLAWKRHQRALAAEPAPKGA